MSIRKKKNERYAVKYYSDVFRVVLGRPGHTLNSLRCHHGQNQADKFSKFMPPDTLKMHFLALSVLSFPCKIFSKLPKLLLQKTLLRR